MNSRTSIDRATDVLESEEFYEMCQSYRTSQEWYPHGLTPTLRFEALKNWIREHCIVPAVTSGNITSCVSEVVGSSEINAGGFVDPMKR